MGMIYYVCSFGGSGSKMLVRYLAKFADYVEHVHGRYPPTELTYVGDSVYYEWFNPTKIPQHKLDRIKVIFIYRNPLDAIYSRFDNPEHLRHIQCPDINVKLEDVVNTKQDLYKVGEFFDNYTKEDPDRNYQIYCVKYEDFFNNIQEFNRILGIPDRPDFYPKEMVTERDKPYYKELTEIYQPLIDKMNKMPFIKIV